MKSLHDELHAQKPQLQNALEPFYENSAVQRLIRMWWEPAAAVIAEQIPSC